jgi:hypothetical protein
VRPVDFGLAELVPDADRAAGWTLLLDGTPQSYVDLNDPTWLEYEYVRRLASVLDATGEPGGGLRVLHLGGGALTLPRYLAATRPGSVQRVVERDAALAALVRQVLPLPRGADLRVRAEDGRVAVESTAAARFDVVVTDVYGGARMPGHFTTVEFARAVARVLRPGGRYAVNVADGPPLAFARGQVATLAAVFGQVCLLAEPGVLRGRRFGNLVLVATGAPRDGAPHDGAPRDGAPRDGAPHDGAAGAAGGSGRLPVEELARSASRDAFPARLLAGDELTRFTAGALPVTDAHAADSPPPPESLFA